MARPKANDVGEWEKLDRKICGFRRAHISRFARSRFEHSSPSEAEFRLFLIAYYAHIKPPSSVIGQAERHAYARAALRRWAMSFGLILSESDIDRIDKESPGRRFYADEMVFLGLKDAEREELKLWQIRPSDITREDFEERRKARDTDRKRRERREKKPHMKDRKTYEATSMTKTEPWLQFGIKERMFRNWRKAGLVAEVRPGVWVLKK